MAEPVEIRADIPREVVDVMDAVTKAGRMHRNELVIQILTEWAENKVHEASLVHRLSRGNGLAKES